MERIICIILRRAAGIDPYKSIDPLCICRDDLLVEVFMTTFSAPDWAIHQMLQHCLPAYFQKCRYYGLHGNACYKKYDEAVPERIKNMFTKCIPHFSEGHKLPLSFWPIMIAMYYFLLLQVGRIIF